MITIYVYKTIQTTNCTNIIIKKSFLVLCYILHVDININILYYIFFFLNLQNYFILKEKKIGSINIFI